MRTPLAALMVVLAASTAAAADDWAQFQGPRGDGTSPERILRREWPAEGPPVLSGGRLLVRTPEELICYDGAGR